MIRDLSAATLIVLLLLAGCAKAGTETPPTPPTAEAPIREETSVIPDLAGLTGAAAAARVEELGWSATFISMAGGEVTAAEASKGIVVQSYPEAGDEVRSNKSVSIFVNLSGATVPESFPTEVEETSAPPAFDLTTDEGLCAADAELTNLELNDAIAPMLGFPGDRDDRTLEQDDAIRAYKNDAFTRACPARAS